MRRKEERGKVRPWARLMHPANMQEKVSREKAE